MAQVDEREPFRDVEFSPRCGSCAASVGCDRLFLQPAAIHFDFRGLRCVRSPHRAMRHLFDGCAWGRSLLGVCSGERQRGQCSEEPPSNAEVHFLHGDERRIDLFGAELPTTGRPLLEPREHRIALPTREVDHRFLATLAEAILTEGSHILPPLIACEVHSTRWLGPGHRFAGFEEDGARAQGCLPQVTGRFTSHPCRSGTAGTPTRSGGTNVYRPPAPARLSIRHERHHEQPSPIAHFPGPFAA